MIQFIPATSRYSVKNEWLESNLSFSFGEYYDESNIHFGPLRVFNDDTIQGGKDLVFIRIEKWRLSQLY